MFSRSTTAPAEGVPVEAGEAGMAARGNQGWAAIVLAGSMLALVALLPWAWSRIGTQGWFFLAVWTVLVATYLLAVRFVWRGPWLAPRVLMLLLAGACVARVFLVLSPPGLSGDIYRYVWDARLDVHGISPYAYAPADPHVRFLVDMRIWPHTGWHDVPTLYPPLAQFIYATVYLLAPDNVIAMKLGLAVFDVATLALLLILLRRHGHPPALAILYAWNPLILLEFSGQGHIDSVATFLMLAAVAGALLLPVSRWLHQSVLVGIFVGLAALAKLYPVVYLASLALWPVERGAGSAMWAEHSRARALAGPLLTGLICVAVVMFGYLPFVLRGQGSLGFLPDYIEHKWNGSIYRFVELLGGTFGWSTQSQHVVPLLLLGIAALSVAGLRLTGPIGPVGGTLALLGTFLATSATVFPWYVTPAIPLAVLLLAVPTGTAIPARSFWCAMAFLWLACAAPLIYLAAEASSKWAAGFIFVVEYALFYVPLVFGIWHARAHRPPSATHV